MQNEAAHDAGRFTALISLYRCRRATTYAVFRGLSAHASRRDRQEWLYVITAFGLPRHIAVDSTACDSGTFTTRIIDYRYAFSITDARLVITFRRRRHVRFKRRDDIGFLAHAG